MNPTKVISNDSITTSSVEAKVNDSDNTIIQIPKNLLDIIKKNIVRGTVKSYDAATGNFIIKTTTGDIILNTKTPFTEGAYLDVKAKVNNQVLSIFVSQEAFTSDAIIGEMGEFIKFTLPLNIAPQSSITATKKHTDFNMGQAIGKELINIDSPFFKLIGILSGASDDYIIKLLPEAAEKNIIPDGQSGKFIDQLLDVAKLHIEDLKGEVLSKSAEYEFLLNFTDLAKVSEKSPWHFFVLPYILKEQLNIMRVYVKKNITDGNKSHRVIADFHFHKTGDCRIDALFIENRKRVYIKFMSDNYASNELANSIRESMQELGTILNARLSVDFEEFTDKEVSPLNEIIQDYCKNKIGEYVA